MATDYDSQDWKWFEDDAAEPITQLADENTAPTITDFSIVRLRFVIRNNGDNTELFTPNLEYSVNESDWFTLNSAAVWNWADGKGTEGDTVTTEKCSTVDDKAKYVESGDQEYSHDDSPLHNENEYDFAIKPTTNVANSTTYYFRVLDASVAQDVRDGYTNPEIATGDLLRNLRRKAVWIQ